MVLSEQQNGVEPEANEADLGPDQKSSIPRDVVLLIHGTFAFVKPSEEEAKNDSSKNPLQDHPWWCPKSIFASKLDEYLNGSAMCWPSDICNWPWNHAAYKGQDERFFGRKAFAWSGKNKETDRRDAGKRLFEGLRFLELHGSPYHIVAHSFGGAVVWYAFLEAKRTGLRLDKLRSWTTMGTPFPEYGSGPMGLLGWTIITCAAALFTTGLWFFWGMQHWWSFVANLIVSMASVFIILFLAQFVLFAFFRSGARKTSRLAEAEKHLGCHLWHEIGNKWLGLYSCKDEAISGLKLSITTLYLPVPRVGGIVAKCFFWCLRILELPGNFALRYLAQGNPKIGSLLAAIRPTPVAEACHRGSLPVQLETDLDKLAKKTSWASARIDSEKFGEFSKTEEIATGAPMKPGRAMFDWLRPNLALCMGLYHTSYYGVDSILRTIACHVGTNSSNPQLWKQLNCSAILSSETHEWLSNQNKRSKSDQALARIDTITWTKRLPWAIMVATLTWLVMSLVYSEYYGRYAVKLLGRLDSRDAVDRETAIDLLITHSEYGISRLIAKLNLLAEKGDKPEGPNINLRKEIHDRFKATGTAAVPFLVSFLQS